MPLNSILSNEAWLFVKRLKDSNTLKDSLKLPEEELLRAEKFRRDSDKNMFIMGRKILRKILSSYLQLDDSEIKFIYINGKPGIDPIQNPHHLKFNLSHSHGILLFSFCIGEETGIDLEWIDPSLNHLELAAQFCSEEEFLYLQNNQDQKEVISRFFRIWTRKEAVVKALSTGLSGIKDFSVLKDEITIQGTCFQITDVAVEPEFKAAVCYSGGRKKIVIEEL